MNTPAPPEQPSLTTEQVLRACADQLKAAGAEPSLVVSQPQLSRWAHAGLLPPAWRRRKPQGYGTEWHWDAECVPRAVLVAQALALGDPSLQRAAAVLAAAGFPPEAERLRLVLLNALDIAERQFTLRQGYLTDDRPQVDKQRQLRKNLRRKMATVPDPLTEFYEQFGSALFGVLAPDDPNVPEAARHLQHVLALPTLRERLKNADGAVLLARYDEISQILPRLLRVLLMSLNLMLLPFIWQRQQEQGHATSEGPMSVDIDSIMQGVRQEGTRVLITPGNPASGIRIFIVLLAAAIPAEELADSGEATTFTAQGMRLLASYLGKDGLVDLLNALLTDSETTQHPPQET
jgi:hypothetical protein